MGRSKPLLPHGNVSGLTFVAHLVEVARAAGLNPIVVVGRPEDELLRAEVARHRADFVENPRAESGQLSSLQAGLSALEADPAIAGVMAMPADVPLVDRDVIERLLRAAAASPALILRAAHDGRHGHPVLFTRAVFDELHAADPAVGARAVVRADPGRVEDVEVGAPGVTFDVDTPDDYLRAFGRRP